jgi:transcriptional regulator with XRE-family HTH domain
MTANETPIEYRPQCAAARLNAGGKEDAKASAIQERNKHIRQWILDVLKQKGWTAERWAREANISATTITRFLKPEIMNRTPKEKTLDILASAAGVPPLHQGTQVLIAITTGNRLLEEARRCAPDTLDLFSMPAEDYLPVLPEYATCHCVRLDDGRMMIVRPCPKSGCRPGSHVLVELDSKVVGIYVYTPDRLISVNLAGRHPLALLDPRHPETHILGQMAAELTPYNQDPDHDDE